MLVTTVQAARETKQTKYQIDKLVKAGVIQDHGVHRPGASRHVRMVNLQEVKAFLRGQNGNGNGNGHFQTSIPAVPSVAFTPTPEPSGQAHSARLLRIEAKLDAVMQQLKALMDAWA